MNILELNDLENLNGGSKAAFCGTIGIGSAVWGLGLALEISWVPVIGTTAAVALLGAAVYCAY